MARTFLYARVSTRDQSTQNQIQEVESAGFAVDKRRIVSETVSGSSSLAQRPGFTKLLDRLEAGDVLVVTKLDRLGRNTIDVAQTVGTLAELGVKVHCLALGGVDLTSPAGRMTMHVISAVAQFERELLVERTQAGLEVAKAKGKILGRPQALDSSGQDAAKSLLASGVSVSTVARELKVSRQTIMRIRDGAQG